MPQSQPGDLNGRVKIRDQQVVELRELRCLSFPKPTFRELAKRFHLHPRTIRRLCIGLERPEAGGPIDPEPDQRPPKLELPGNAYDRRRIIRCRRCRFRSHPSIADPELCFGCISYLTGDVPMAR